MCREEQFTTWLVWLFPSLKVSPKALCRYIGTRCRSTAHSRPANPNTPFFFAHTPCANRRPNTVYYWHIGHCDRVETPLCIPPYMVEQCMCGHSGAQLVQYGTQFVPKEQLRSTRRVKNYILKSSVFGKPREKGYFIFYIIHVWVIEREEAHRSSSTRCGRRTDNCNPRKSWLPHKVPRPQITSVHGSLFFMVATKWYLSTHRKFGFK